MARTIKTSSGDTWDLLSKKAYGDEKYMHTLISANIQHRKTVVFRSSVVLTVPDIDVTVEAYDESYPIWSRTGGAV